MPQSPKARQKGVVLHALPFFAPQTPAHKVSRSIARDVGGCAFASRFAERDRVRRPQLYWTWPTAEDGGYGGVRRPCMFLNRRSNRYALGYDERDGIDGDGNWATSVLHPRGVMLRPARQRGRGPRRQWRNRWLHQLGSKRILAHSRNRSGVVRGEEISEWRVGKLGYVAQCLLLPKACCAVDQRPLCRQYGQRRTYRCFIDQKKVQTPFRQAPLGKRWPDPVDEWSQELRLRACNQQLAGRWIGNYQVVRVVIIRNTYSFGSIPVYIPRYLGRVLLVPGLLLATARSMSEAAGRLDPRPAVSWLSRTRNFVWFQALSSLPGHTAFEISGRSSRSTRNPSETP